MRGHGRLGVASLCLGASVLAGCTLVGYGIGSIADGNSNARTRGVTPLAVVTAHPGQDVELTLRDGGITSGRFQGMERVPDALYGERWRQSLQALAGVTALPVLGPVRVRRKDGSESEATLLGLRPGNLVVSVSSAGANALPLDSLAELRGPGGGSVDGVTLARLASEGRLPFLDAVIVKQDTERRAVPLESVRSASFITRRGRNVGAIVGAVMDLAVVALIIVAATDDYNSGSSDDLCGSTGCTSCPLVYGRSAAGLALEAEPLGGSLFAADEAVDRARLDGIEVLGGAYHLEVRNEMQEVEHLDAIRLLVVDHAPGVEIVPAMDGSLFAVGKGAAPTRATDATGANLAPALREADGRTWAELPIGRDPDDPVSRRGTATLEFARPAGATTAVLDLTLRSTRWGMALLGDVLGLQGRGIDSFWSRMESDPARRGALRRAWAREALPHLQVETRGGWRDAAVLAHIPTLVNGRRAVPLDLRDLEGDVLRVRIEAMPGLWEFDRIAVDYAARPAPAATVLLPASARNSDGSDAQALLMASDDQRLTLPTRRGQVDLTFAAPARATGQARSVLVEMEGYYRPQFPAVGEPQSALFDRLVDEPGALTRYVLAGVDEATRRVARGSTGRTSPSP